MCRKNDNCTTFPYELLNILWFMPLKNKTTKEILIFKIKLEKTLIFDFVHVHA